MDHQRLEALKFYRAALDIDPTFKPAGANLDRATSWNKFGKIDMGPDEKDDSAGDERLGEGKDEE